MIEKLLKFILIFQIKLGKRTNNNFIAGVKNIPRVGRRSGFTQSAEDMKFYSHVQPFNSKFILDFLSDELSINDGDLKFVSWNDFDKALESDTELKNKLTSISRDKEIDELKKLIHTTSDDDNEVYGRPMYNDGASNKIYQKFIPYDKNSHFKYNNMENEVYYYNNNDGKRSSIKGM